MRARALLLVVLVLTAGCYTYVPCEWTTTGIATTEVTPLGFSPADAAGALSATETLALIDAEGAPIELEVTTEVLLVETPGGGGRPPIPSVTTRHGADGSEVPGYCEGTEVHVGNIEARVISTDGRIDERWVVPLTLVEALPGTTVTLTHSPSSPGGTWSPGASVFGRRQAVFEVSVTASESGARIAHVSVVARDYPHVKGPPEDEPLVVYDAP